MPFTERDLQSDLRRRGKPIADRIVWRVMDLAPSTNVAQQDGTTVTEHCVTRPDAELAVQEAQLSDPEAIAALAYLLGLNHRTDARRSVDEALVKLVMSQA